MRVEHEEEEPHDGPVPHLLPVRLAEVLPRALLGASEAGEQVLVRADGGQLARRDGEGDAWGLGGRVHGDAVLPRTGIRGIHLQGGGGGVGSGPLGTLIPRHGRRAI